MECKKNWRKASAAHARVSRWLKSCENDDIEILEPRSDSGEFPSTTTVNDGDGLDFGSGGDRFAGRKDEGWGDEASWKAEENWEEEGLEGEELEGEELIESLHRESEHEMRLLEECHVPTAYEQLNSLQLTAREWKKAKKNRGFGYTGNSTWTKQRCAQMAQKKEESDVILQERCVVQIKQMNQLINTDHVLNLSSKGAELMHAFFSKGHTPMVKASGRAPTPVAAGTVPCGEWLTEGEVFTGYPSDISEDVTEDEEFDESDNENLSEETPNPHFPV